MSGTIYEKQGTTLTVKPQGRLDTATSPVLEKELEQHLDGVKDVIMDFSSVEYISSSGLRLFMSVLKNARKYDSKVFITGMGNDLRQVFDEIGFTNLFLFQ